MEEPRLFRRTSRKFARDARSHMTKGEAFLWQLLRRNGVGARFRRQMPIGPYFADFACPSARLIIEVDGHTHDDDEAQARDRERQSWLERLGWTVLRFRDEATIGSMMVEDTIHNAVRLRLTKRSKM